MHYSNASWGHRDVYLRFTLLKLINTFMHCSGWIGSVTFWYIFGSGDPYLCLLDSDPALFVSDLQDPTNFFFSLGCFAFYFMKAH